MRPSTNRAFTWIAVTLIVVGGPLVLVLGLAATGVDVELSLGAGLAVLGIVMFVWLVAAPILVLITVVIAVRDSIRVIAANPSGEVRSRYQRTWAIASGIAVAVAIPIVIVYAGLSGIAFLATLLSAAVVCGAAVVFWVSLDRPVAPGQAPGGAQPGRGRATRWSIVAVAALAIFAVGATAVQGARVSAYHDAVDRTLALDRENAATESSRDVVFARICLGAGDIDQRFQNLESIVTAEPPVLPDFRRARLQAEIDAARTQRAEVDRSFCADVAPSLERRIEQHGGDVDSIDWSDTAYDAPLTEYLRLDVAAPQVRSFFTVTPLAAREAEAARHAALDRKSALRDASSGERTLEVNALGVYRIPDAATLRELEPHADDLPAIARLLDRAP
ncbi:hypothetical protein [Leucobacter japonicus]|uniref:hypothetical protein n=1 Tax=Leucobacter japonicus TaxID=1461259 RepID=UPI0006A7744D|nr:hypothetical protein [Leucobacter japonicus]